VDRVRQRRGAARGDSFDPALHGLRLQRLRRLNSGRHPSHSGIDVQRERMGLCDEIPRFSE
jgi:hypothetical protein